MAVDKLILVKSESKAKKFLKLTALSPSNLQQDQFEGVSYHTSKGIDFLDKYGSFIKERSAIEADYASKLRRLVKNHQYKKKDESDTQ